MIGESQIDEKLLLGEVGREPEKSERIRCSKLDPAVAMSMTRQMQPTCLFRSQYSPEGFEHSPVCPAPEFARDLRLAIAVQLGLDGNDEGLRYYTGVHAPIDYVGIDSWFELDGEGLTSIVSLDLTENPDKYKDKDSCSDHIVFYNPDKHDRQLAGEESYIRFVERNAKTLADLLAERSAKGEVGQWHHPKT